MLALALVWGTWVTRTLVHDRPRPVVAVGLNELLGAFVAAEGRRPGSRAEASVRTRRFLDALDDAVAALERDGTIVLVRESVLGRGVVDRTGAVRARIEASLARGQ
jgi:hypothetical protein